MKICEETQIDFNKDFEAQMSEVFPKKESFLDSMDEFLAPLSEMDFDERVDAINRLRLRIHELSPFKDEPVDCVQWVKNDTVTHNDYNPNKVAPPEMKLLELSITNDGYTQPIVSWSNPEKDMIEVIDGFHRHRVGKESAVVNQRVNGYLPVVDIRTEQSSKSDRMASTIRHNRARGKHQVDAMSEIVIELKNRNWRNARIAKELGMDEEEVLRLLQISGMTELFGDEDFSRAWVADDSEETWEDIGDELDEETVWSFRATNTQVDGRVFHTYDKWECHKAGFYATSVDGKSKEECESEYAEFLRDLHAFEEAAMCVISEWKYSCEHYLTNKAMNRIAWIGQASMCYANGIPSRFCAGFNQLSKEEQEAADAVALKVLNHWLNNQGQERIDMEEAASIGRQMEIY
jgi:ParB-like chromosome segregation protein Spo0J